VNENVMKPNTDLHKSVALIGIALELKYGTLDQFFSLYAEQGDVSEDQIKNIDQQINQLKEQMRKLEEILQATEEIMPKLMDALGNSSDDAVCSDSDPRKVEFLRLWDNPIIVVEDWQELSKSFSPKEKAAFVERMLLIIEQLGVDQLGLSDLYPRPAL
jgi:seryl-tRNA synthetase